MALEEGGERYRQVGPGWRKYLTMAMSLELFLALVPTHTPLLFFASYT